MILSSLRSDGTPTDASDLPVGIEITKSPTQEKNITDIEPSQVLFQGLTLWAYQCTRAQSATTAPAD